ncbi:MAG TPA: Spy/CpxP family protein refolding chaperone [Rhodocyclaceae bacterium]|nr:Spy/CpxP family protein refolding chaperone [Rhodocyclaceae bacterium]
MKSFTRRAVLAALSTSLVLAFAPLSSAAAAEPAKDPAKDQAWAQHRQEWAAARLTQDANRLEIKASQQAAWAEYANARKALADWKFTKLPDDADAATVAKHRAERATEAAQKLTALADATAKLQAVLTPEQRKTLDQLVRHHHCGHEHGGWGERGMHGMHGMHEGFPGAEGGCDMKEHMGMGHRPAAAAKGQKAPAAAQPDKK